MHSRNTWTCVPSHRWPRVALLALLFSFFGILGIPSPAGTPNKSHVGVSRPTPTPSVSSLGTAHVEPPPGGFRVINRVSLDWRDDDRTRSGRSAISVVASGCAMPACTYNIECDDGDKCTIDSCVQTDPIGACAGSCIHTAVPNGESGGCDDGLVCNGRETCNQNGQCVAGTAPDCCNQAGMTSTCSESFPRCSNGSMNAGAGCRSNADCTGGTCERCQPVCTSAADCNDGVECNGTEICVAGSCVPGLNPCGFGADCAEGRCNGTSVGCNSDEDCSAFATFVPCILSQPYVCFTGRCCTPDTGDPDDQMQCSDVRGLATTIVGQGGCALIAGSRWYPGDTGRDDNTDLCGGEDPTNQLEDEWGCPKYSFGINQNNVSVPPFFRTPAAGPISNSPASVASPRGPNGPLNRLGDDYVLSNAGYFGLDAIRWVGGVDSPGRLVVEFRDSGGVLIEDALTPSLAPGLGVQVLAFTPSITIPAAGFVTMRVATEYSPNLRFSWFSTNAANSVGGNDGNRVWVNNGPAAGATNFLGPGNGILAMELVGDKIPAPVGACCAPVTGECADNVLPWTCTAVQGGVFHGVGSRCAVCNGGANAGSDCRRCAGGANNGLACNNDADCPDGNCDPDNTQCPGLTCTVGQVGNSCTANSQCTIVGSCPAGFCVSGNVGAACTPGPAGDAFCTIEGVCGAATCQFRAECAGGACCNPTTGQCTVSTAGGCSGMFQGYGTSCDADGGYDNGQQHCCPQPTAMRCMDGPSNLDACAADLDCGQCVGGAQAGQPCDDTADCPEGACVGRCLNRFSGADRCEDALMHILTVPSQGAPPLVKTITGDDTLAGQISPVGDACVGSRTAPPFDLGWYETFEITECARVRIDFCCTEPQRVIGGEYLFPIDMQTGACLCDEPILAGSDPYIVGQAQSKFGSPYCADGGFWVTFPLLPAGRYAYPIYSSAAGPRGPYQMHITVEPCPIAACCYESCSGNGEPCDLSSPCPVGETCDGHCDMLNQSACDALRGNWLGPPQTTSIVPLCGANDEACAGGACCTGPGDCEDSHLNNNQPMTKAECDSRGGNYVGGVPCSNHYCMGSANCEGVPCYVSSDCCSGSSCTGPPDLLPNPCPICEIEGPNHCQAYDGGGLGVLADFSFPTAHAVADDFIHGGGDIETICVWGAYYNLDPESVAFDCGANVAYDSFRVRIYNDAGGRPGAVEAERTVVLSGPNYPRGVVHPTGVNANIGTGVNVYQYQLALPTPISGLSPGACYWIEVVNDHIVEAYPRGCTWSWMRLGSESPHGNRFAFVGDADAGYVPGGEVHWDQAFCLNTTFLPGGCGPREGACCACGTTQSAPPDPRCSVSTLESCDAAGGEFQSGQATCSGFSCPLPPPNDACADAIDAAVGPHPFSTTCATTDGHTSLLSDFTRVLPRQDLWYHFTVPNNPAVPNENERCDLVASLCGTGSTFDNSEAFDSVIAIYKDSRNYGVCPCPTDALTADATFIKSEDENCYKAALGGPAFVEVPDARPGECYTIRVGGYPGPDQSGRGILNISCGEPFCGDNRRNGSEACDGTDVPPGFACTPDCTALAPVICGDGFVTGDEECDPNCFNCNLGPQYLSNGCYVGSPSCDPVTCKCAAFCGNLHVETGEDCDSTDDDACPGQCGEPGGDPSDDCRCPVPICGNNIVEAGEECDGNGTPDACICGACRPPGDVFGGCTCACGDCGDPPIPIVWNSDPNGSLRAMRSLTFSVAANAASGTSNGTAIEIRLVDLMNPVPANPLCCPAPNFSSFEAATCTAAGETNGCERWVGPLTNFQEYVGDPRTYAYRGARLQCTPYYYDWSTEPQITVVGAEIVPSSTYEARVYHSVCKGDELGCPYVSPPVTMLTRRWGDLASSWNPPAPTTQPDALDIVALVNKFRNVPGAPSKRVALIQPNAPDFNTDVNALDIVSVVDAFRGLQYPFSGPCPCPAVVTCNSIPCTSPSVCGNGTCVRTCAGGANVSQPCLTDAACWGGTCGPGFCRDRCGRCN